MLFALFNITLTIVLPNAYVAYDREVKPPINFAVAELYADCRSELKNFFKVYWTNSAIAFVYGWAVFGVYYYTAVKADFGEGEPMDLFTYGIFITCVSALLIHI